MDAGGGFHGSDVATVAELLGLSRQKAMSYLYARGYRTKNGRIRAPSPGQPDMTRQGPLEFGPPSRDPCWNCGTRREIGCEHHPLEARESVGA